MSIFDGVNKETLDKAEEYGGGKFFKVGENPCRIKEVYEDVSKTGKDMLVVLFENGASGAIKTYITDGEYKLKILKNLMTSFAIDFAELHNLKKWVGKRGVVVCKEGEEYNGKKYPKVSHFRSLKDLKNDTSFKDDIPF